MNFVIEKGIPMPARIGKTVYPFADMQVGDSFSIPASEDAKKRSTQVARAGWAHGKKDGKKFSIRQTPEGGLRVWRVK
jgi:hypothetical protein